VNANVVATTVNENVVVAVVVPEVPVTVMVVVPNWFAAGVIDNVRVDTVFGPTTMLALGTNVVLLDVAVMVVKGVAASPTLKVNVGSAVSSLVDLSEMSSTEGSASNAPMSTVCVVLASGPSALREKPVPRWSVVKL